MKRKNNHYVPQFHLRQWSHNNRGVSSYNKRNKKYVPYRPIQHTASKDYFYGKDTITEEVLGDFESQIAPVYQKIFNQKNLNNFSDIEKELLLLQLAMSDSRTLEAGNVFEQYSKEIFKKLVEFENAKGTTTLKPEDMDDIKIVDSSHIPLTNAMQYYMVLADLKFVLIRNTSNVEFLTSDSPSVLYNHWFAHRKIYQNGWGQASAGVTIFMPISPHMAIMAIDTSIYEITKPLQHNDTLILNQDGQINELNKLILADSNNEVFFSPNVKESYIKRLLKTIPEIEQERVSVLENGNQTMFLYSEKRVWFSLNLTFLKVHKDFANLPIPQDMRGLVRPFAEATLYHLDRYWKQEEEKYKRENNID